MVAIAGEEFDARERVACELLLPTGAGNHEARLVNPARRKNELACDGAEDDDRSRWIVKRVELALVQGLVDESQIERSIVDAPAERELGEIIGPGEKID